MTDTDETPKPLTPKERAIKDCIAITRTFCCEETRRADRLPPNEATWKGNFITTFESDLINQFKQLLK